MEENQLVNPCEVLIFGGSAGSLTVLFALLPSLKPDFPFSIILVLHRKNSVDSSLSELFGVKTPIPVREVEDKDPLLPGIIYIAPADYHLLIEKNHTFSLDYSEKVNFSRPSIDVTFESAAEIYGPRLVAIILSGANEDGSKGLAAVKAAGGVIIAQQPSSAQMPMMPQSAIAYNKIDQILTPEEISTYILNLMSQ
jgi:two-component system, chemotaxis family, protein-glutamate methylesterase/glutaminase